MQLSENRFVRTDTVPAAGETATRAMEPASRIGSPAVAAKQTAGREAEAKETASKVESDVFGKELPPSPRRISHPWMLRDLGIGGDFPVRVEARISVTVAPGGGARAVREFFDELARLTAFSEQPEYISLSAEFAPGAGPTDLLAVLDEVRASVSPSRTCLCCWKRASSAG